MSLRAAAPLLSLVVLAAGCSAYGGSGSKTSAWPDAGPYYYGGCGIDAGACQLETLACTVEVVRTRYALCIEDLDCELVRLHAPCADLCEPAAVYVDDSDTFRDEATLQVNRFCGQAECMGHSPSGCSLPLGSAVCRNGACAFVPEAADGGSPDAGLAPDVGVPDAGA